MENETKIYKWNKDIDGMVTMEQCRDYKNCPDCPHRDKCPEILY